MSRIDMTEEEKHIVNRLLKLHKEESGKTAEQLFGKVCSASTLSKLLNDISTTKSETYDELLECISYEFDYDFEYDFRKLDDDLYQALLFMYEDKYEQIMNNYIEVLGKSRGIIQKKQIEALQTLKQIEMELRAVTKADAFHLLNYRFLFSNQVSEVINRQFWKWCINTGKLEKKEMFSLPMNFGIFNGGDLILSALPRYYLYVNKPIDAILVTNKCIQRYKETENYNRLAEAYKMRLLLVMNWQESDIEPAINDCKLFINENKERISQDIIMKTNYQIGLAYFWIQQYIDAYQYLINIDITISRILANCCASMMNDEEKIIEISMDPLMSKNHQVITQYYNYMKSIRNYEEIEKYAQLDRYISSNFLKFDVILQNSLMASIVTMEIDKVVKHTKNYDLKKKVKIK